MSNGGPIQPSRDPVAREGIKRIEAKLAEMEDSLEEMEGRLGGIGERLEKTDAAIVDIYDKLPMM